MLIQTLFLASCALAPVQKDAKEATEIPLENADVWGTGVLRGPVPPVLPEPRPPILVSEWLAVEESSEVESIELAHVLAAVEAPESGAAVAGAPGLEWKPVTAAAGPSLMAPRARGIGSRGDPHGRADRSRDALPER